MITRELEDAFAAATRVGRIVGCGVPNFFRRPYGPGWALVGRRRLHQGPDHRAGISEAFRGAQWCAEAIDAALSGRRDYDDAMADYQRRRDDGAMPIYEFTTQLATLEPPPPEQAALFAAMAGNADAMDGFVSVYAGTLSPVDFFAPRTSPAILSAAA